MQNTRTYVVVMSKISVKMPHLLFAITSANFVIFLVSDNSTSWRGKRLHFPEIHGTDPGQDLFLFKLQNIDFQDFKMAEASCVT